MGVLKKILAGLKGGGKETGEASSVSRDAAGKRLGMGGEAAAAAFLEKKGFKIIDRNYRTRRGEVDIIAVDKKTLVFVEVKTRKKGSLGLPKEAVNSRKQSRMIAAAKEYMLGAKAPYSEMEARFDVVGLEGGEGAFEVEHIKGAFEAWE